MLHVFFHCYFMHRKTFIILLLSITSVTAWPFVMHKDHFLSILAGEEAVCCKTLSTISGKWYSCYGSNFKPIGTPVTLPSSILQFITIIQFLPQFISKFIILIVFLAILCCP